MKRATTALELQKHKLIIPEYCDWLHTWQPRRLTNINITYSTDILWPQYPGYYCLPAAVTRATSNLNAKEVTHQIGHIDSSWSTKFH